MLIASQSQIQFNIYNFFLNFGCNFESLDEIIKNYLQYQNLSIEELNEQEFKIHLLIFYCNIIHKEQLHSYYCDTVKIFYIQLDSIYKRVMAINNLKNTYKKYINKPFQFHIKHRMYVYNQAQRQIELESWTNFDDFLLVKGILKHGSFLFFIFNSQALINMKLL